MTHTETEDEFEFSPTAIVLHCFDVTGREVIASYGRWKHHIRGRHAEVNDYYDAVKETLQAPYRIVQDKTYPNRLNYYRHGALPSPYDRLFLKV